MDNQASGDIPAYSASGMAAKATLYSDLQNLDIFVEDSSLKEVYNELIRKLDIKGLVFHTVIPLGSRYDVLDHAASHPDVLRYCYIVDGDLLHAIRDSDISDCRVLTHRKYCFENYLFNQGSCRRLVYEQLGNTDKAGVTQIVGWDDFRQIVEDGLVPLFVLYAAAFYLAPSVETVGRGLGTLVNKERGRLTISAEKVHEEKRRVVSEMLSFVSRREIGSTIALIRKRIELMPDKLDIVSGKDHLLKLLADHIAHCASSISKKSFKMRLMLNTDLAEFQDVKMHLENCTLGVEG